MSLNKVALEAEYDRLYDAANAALAKHNPCQIQRDEAGHISCADTRRYSNETGYAGSPTLCCGGCQHLGPQGCTAKSLCCKLWLCNTARTNGYYGDGPERPIVAELATLRRHGMALGVPVNGMRDTKEEAFRRLR